MGLAPLDPREYARCLYITGHTPYTFFRMTFELIWQVGEFLHFWDFVKEDADMEAAEFARAVERLGEETGTPLKLVLEARDTIGQISLKYEHEQGAEAAKKYRASQFIGLQIIWRNPAGQGTSLQPPR